MRRLKRKRRKMVRTHTLSRNAADERQPQQASCAEPQMREPRRQEHRLTVLPLSVCCVGVQRNRAK